MKKTMLRFAILCLAAVLCLTVLSGCDLFTSKYDIQWNAVFEKETSENVSITVDGYDRVPDKVSIGEEISFTLEGTNGYYVYRVKINNRKVTPNENGKYVVTVTQDTEVEITLREKVASVVMPDLEFFAGQEIDRKAVEAEIVYATGRSEKTNKYSIVYQNESADSFSLGDTYYSVKVSADRENLYTVTLKSPVACMGTIDPHGGVISDAYFEALKSNTDITNVQRDANGVITFLYTKPLSKDIALPSGIEITKGDGDDFTFNSWSGKFSAGTSKSVEAVAKFDAKLVTLDSVKFELRIVDGEEVPYLVITGKYVGATSVYLYLAETNKGIELAGPTVGGDAERGDSFELLFDLRETNIKEYIGSWMDVQIRSDIDGYTEVQEFNVVDNADIEIDLSSNLLHRGYSYVFQTYDDLLKLETSEYFDNGYKLSYTVNDKGEVILTIAGNVVTSYAGNYVKLDIEYDSSSGNVFLDPQYCLIDKSGNYSVSFNLFDIPIGHNAYVHFWIIDNMEDENRIFTPKENNLLNEWCMNTNLDSKYTGVGLITDGGIRCPNPDSTKTYFVGKGKWGGITIYGKNDTEMSYSTNSAEIYIEDGRVKIAVIGSYTGTKAGIEAELNTWAYDVMENPYAASNGSSWNGGWTGHTPPYVITVSDDGSFRFIFDVTDIGWENSHEKACYTFHLGRAGTGSGDNANPDLILTGSLGNSSVTHNGKTYSLMSEPSATSDGAKFWGCLGLTIQ